MPTWGAGKIIRYFDSSPSKGAYVTVSSANGYTFTFTNDGGSTTSSPKQFVAFYYGPILLAVSDIVPSLSFTYASKTIVYRVNPYYANDYYPDTNIVVVDPPTGSSGFIFVDTSTQQKIVLLPDPAQCSGKMLFIKDKSWNAGATATLGNYNILVIPPDGVLIDGAAVKSISDKGGCLILVCDGSTYYIANYCKPATQLSYGGIYNANVKTAVANKICVFTVDVQNNRAVQLPSAAGNSGAICIILVTSTSTNNLYINTAIDNSPAVNPYVSSPTDTGRNYISVIFICDGATWYSAGVHSGANISRTTNTSINMIDLSSVNTFAKTTKGSYALPFINISTSIAGLVIMKSPVDSIVEYCRGPYSIIIAGSTNTPNSSVRISANAACIWFYTQTGAIYTNYYVILSYIP